MTLAPRAQGTTSAKYLAAFDRYVTPSVRRFAPDLILISAGFDAHKDDLFRFFKLTDKTYKVMTELVMDLAERCCAGRVARGSRTRVGAGRVWRGPWRGWCST